MKKMFIVIGAIVGGTLSGLYYLDKRIREVEKSKELLCRILADACARNNNQTHDLEERLSKLEHGEG